MRNERRTSEQLSSFHFFEATLAFDVLRADDGALTFGVENKVSGLADTGRRHLESNGVGTAVVLTQVGKPGSTMTDLI